MARTHATIRDVAAAVGVSPATVSRALARPQLVAAATAEKVRRAADELGYAPSPQARWLQTGRAQAFTLVLPDITNPFFFDLIRGAQREAARAGYGQTLVDTEESAEQELHQLQIARRTSDGAVLGGSRLSNQQIGSLADQFPVVLVNRRVRTVPSVVIDTLPALRESVQHLADLGHRRIAYFGGPWSAWFEERRWQAVQATAEALRLSCDRLGFHQPTMEAGEKQAPAIADGDATAVITYNDLQALGLLHGLESLAVAVPDQVSVVGCDDIFGSQLIRPALTTVSASAEHAGQLATRALIAQVTGQHPRRVNQVVPATLRIRASTGPAPGRRRP
jgi:LacI family repressor for deo operon, udp, cdd, tsx, nupC, and nupG